MRFFKGEKEIDDPCENCAGRINRYCKANGAPIEYLTVENCTKRTPISKKSKRKKKAK